jgi:arsenate reductase
VEIWINPECSKCASALTILDAEQVEYTVRHYLEQPPTAAELADVLVRLALEPWDVARLGEPVAADLGLAGWPRDDESRQRWIDTADDGTATVARSPEAVRSVLDRRTG